ncbi:23S rRNA pseudouridine(1911/1915/1917) synthase RluD [Denitratisoma oestradiolicum]|nr:23S rRNA pseudouridine(1911/1915/1917) synthase RluD [Denitratisoma oestradiolicum]
MKALETNAGDYSPSPAALRRGTIPRECAGLRLDAALAQLFPDFSRSRLQAWMKAGRVRVAGAPAEDPKAKAWGGESVELDPTPEPLLAAHVAEAMDLPVIHEDEAILVIDKPVGLVVHPGSGNWSGTLLNALLHHAPELEQLPRAGIVHRLDKDTSGLMVVAKTLAAQTDLVRQLQARSVKRHYLALVQGLLARDGTVDAPIGRHPSQRVKMAVVAGGREARTHYQVLERFPRATLVECRLDTGRTHQIRVHMASLGHPLVGDETYGRRRTGDALLDAFPRQALHAWRLGLIHPENGETMHWESPPPADFAQLLAELRSRTP